MSASLPALLGEIKKRLTFSVIAITQIDPTAEYSDAPSWEASARDVKALLRALELAIEQRDDAYRSQGDDVHWAGDIDDANEKLIRALKGEETK